MAKLSLKSRSILIVSSIIIFFGFLACYSVFIYSRKFFLSNENQAMQSFALQQAELNRVFFDQSKVLLETIANQNIIKDYLINDQSKQDQNVLAKLESYNLGQRYLAIYLLDTDGLALVSTDESFVGQDYAFREYFQRALKGEPYFDVAVGVTSGQLGYYFSQSVVNENNKVLGVLVAKLNPQAVEDSLRFADNLAEQQANIFLVDKFGVVIYSNKKDVILSSLGQINSETQRLLKNTQRFAGKEIKALSYDVVQGALFEASTKKTFQLYDEKDEAEEILSLAKISDYPFFILIEKEVDIFIKQAYAISWSLAIFVALAAIFAMIFISLFIRNIFKPLASLQQGLLAAVKGDFNQQIIVSSDDELEDLGDSFNSLIRQLKKNKESVEKKVAEKTKNLEKLNQHTVERELKMIALKKELSDLQNKK
jgi:C4-dicarboxylate-specific signal transduction histidine kinase